MPRRFAGAALMATLLISAAAPGVAAAASTNSATSSAPVVPVPTTGSSPLSPGLPVSPTPTTTSATPTVVQSASSSSSGSSSFSGSSAVFIAIGAVVVLAGISVYIWRDARRRAPARGSEGFEIRRSGSKRPPKPRKLSPAERKRRKRGRARR